MIDFDSAKAACETYVRCLTESDLEALLDLFADDAAIEDPVGTDWREGQRGLARFLRGGLPRCCQGRAHR